MVCILVLYMSLAMGGHWMMHTVIALCVSIMEPYWKCTEYLALHCVYIH